MRFPATVVIAVADLTLAQMLAKTVENVGGYPLVVHEGVQARAVALAGAPSMLIADLTMPRLDASSLVRALRDNATARGASLPAAIFIAAASYTNAEAIGPDVVLRQPIDQNMLDEILRHLLT